MQTASQPPRFLRRLFPLRRRFQTPRKQRSKARLTLLATLVLILVAISFLWHTGYEVPKTFTDSFSQHLKPLKDETERIFEHVMHSGKRGRILLDASRKNLRADPQKMEAVRNAMAGAWGIYVKEGWGSDEWRWDETTHSGSGQINTQFGNGCFALTIIDAADTLWVMGLEKEYEIAREFLIGENNQWDWKKCGNTRISTFEVTIRVLGGLISLYELTGDNGYLSKAQELGRRMGRSAFIEGEGLPRNGFFVNNDSADSRNFIGEIPLSEAGTLQMEFRHLAAISKDKEFDQYRTFVENTVLKSIPEATHRQFGENFSLPFDQLFWSEKEKRTTFTSSRVALGSGSDSYYEYLIKAHLQSGASEKDKEFRDLFDRTMKDALGTIIIPLDDGKIITGASYDPGRNRSHPYMEHLSCFAGAMLALGANTIGSNITFDVRSKYMAAAAGITELCYEMYHTADTGLGPESVIFREVRTLSGRYRHKITPTSTSNRHDLRPEVIESIFYMYRFTGDEKYRKWGWEMYQAWEKHSRTPSGGYSGVRNVWRKDKMDFASKDGNMNSWFLAETLKYLYLLFADSSTVSLDEWVFNTEAHPFRVRPEFGESATEPVTNR